MNASLRLDGGLTSWSHTEQLQYIQHTQAVTVGNWKHWKRKPKMENGKG